MNIFARSIYLARVKKGFSQNQLALKAGVPQPNLSNIEKGRDFKISTLLQIASALDMSIKDLIQDGHSIAVNKKQLFKRDNLEKAISSVIHKEFEPKNFKSAIKLISSIGNNQNKYLTKKQAHLSWYNLKQSFSNEEINTILSRLNKAKRRQE